jgi:carbamoyl-phosphate synthase large subunit
LVSPTSAGAAEGPGGGTGPTVLVTGVGGGGLGCELIKALRRSTIGYRVLAADMDPEAFGLALGDESLVLPPARSPEYVPAVAAACATRGVAVVVPGSEPEIAALVQPGAGAELAASGALLLSNAADGVATCSDKARFTAFLAAAGFCHPRTWLDPAAGEVPADAFPVVVKPARGGSGSNAVHIAQDRDELAFFVAHVGGGGGAGGSGAGGTTGGPGERGGALVQAYVGSAEEEYTVGVLSGLDGTWLATTVMHRQITRGLSNRLRVVCRTGPRAGEVLAISSGLSQGRFVHDEAIAATCRRLAGALGSRGPLNVQLRRDRDELYPFEVNPRFSGTVALRAMAGVNEVDALIRRELLGEELGPLGYRDVAVVRGLAERML